MDDGLIRLLNHDSSDPAAVAEAVGLSAERSLELHALMVLTRRVDSEAIALQRQGHLGVYASCRGQEAAQVGSAAAMAPDDWAFITYRERGVELVRGVDPAERLQVEAGRRLGGYDTKVARMGLSTIPIATQLLHAVGYALGAKLDGRNLVVLAYVGDGGTSEGDFHEALNFASVFQVPVVFFVQNNGYAISTPVSKQTHADSFALKAPGYGMPGYLCDGNDVLAVHSVTAEAIDKARQGSGPMLIEARTYRVGAHTTADDSGRYRPADEVKKVVRDDDPIQRFEAFLLRWGVGDAEAFRAAEEAAAAAAMRMRDAMLNAGDPQPAEMFENVYVDPRGHFEAQARQLSDELDRD